MATSKTAVANRGLQLLGAPRIADIDQTGSPSASNMKTAYEPCKRKLLRQYPWSFAISRASVAADAAQTTWGELYRYALPLDFLRLLRNKEIDYLDERHDWTIEKGYIVTKDGAPLQFRYIADITDPTLYDASFDEALAALLAYNCCEAITQSNTKKDEMKDAMKDAIAEARHAGAIEKGAQDSVEDEWLTAMR